jgi:hypothetical protein
MASKANSTDTSADEKKFMAYAAANNKHYKDKGEMATRLGNFKKNHAKVEELNKTNKGVTFNLNENADLTVEEFLLKQGLDTKNMPKNNSPDGLSKHDGKGRHLQANMSINWADAGKMTPVK